MLIDTEAIRFYAFAISIKDSADTVRSFLNPANVNTLECDFAAIDRIAALVKKEMKKDEDLEYIVNLAIRGAGFEEFANFPGFDMYRHHKRGLSYSQIAKKYDSENDAIRKAVKRFESRLVRLQFVLNSLAKDAELIKKLAKKHLKKIPRTK